MIQNIRNSNQNNYINTISFIAVILHILTPVYPFTKQSTTPLYSLPTAIILVIGLLFNRGKIKLKNESLFAILLFLQALVSVAINNRGFNTSIISYLLYILIFILVSSNSYSDLQVQIIIRIIKSTAILLSSLVILSFLFGIPYSGASYYARYSIYIFGLSKNPNYVGGYFVIGFVLILYNLIYSEAKFWTRIRWLFYCLLIIFAGLLTGSRAVIINIVVSTVMIIVLCKPISTKKRKPVKTIIVLGIFLFLTSYLLRYIPSKIAQRLLNSTFSDEGRLEMWLFSFEQLKNGNFLIGLGLGSSSFLLKNEEFSNPYLHNVLLQLLIEQGLLGFLLYVLIFLSLLCRVKEVDRAFIFTLSATVFIPILFQNGLIAITLWFPIVLISIFANRTSNHSLSIHSIVFAKK